MKLGASYNLFDGEELLRDSILSIRDSVDFISVVYQKESNYGNPYDPRVDTILDELIDEKLVDFAMPIQLDYDPDHWQPHERKHIGAFNEVNKRNVGIEISRQKGCTHHLAIDVDEFYLKEEFDAMKEVIEEHDPDTTACKMLTYYKKPTLILDPPEDYYVSFIIKINPETKFHWNHPFPVNVDPTRKLKPGKFLQLGRKGIQMHHMSYVREDLNIKLTNSSALTNWSDKRERLVEYWKDWKPGEQAFLAGIDDFYSDLKEIDNLFNVKVGT